MNKNKIGIAGIGKLGLCFALNLESVGYNIDAYDVNLDYINNLSNKTFKSFEPEVNELLEKSKSINFTNDIDVLLTNSLIFIVVATPSLSEGNYDHSQIEKFFKSIKNKAKPNTNFVICCTVMPGYCEKLSKKLKYKISYNPEFIAQGSIIYDQKYPDMVLIGEFDKKCGNEIEKVYNSLTQNNPAIKRMSPTEAEITKLALNCYITTKIAFANMVGDIVLRTNNNPDKVLDAIGSDSRVGNKYFKYGFGYGGPCFPRDNQAFRFFCKDNKILPLIQEATMESNENHLSYQVNLFKKTNKKSKPVIIDSVTYKKKSIILEASQQLLFALHLAHIGYKVIIKETQPVIDELKIKYGDTFKYITRK